MKRECTFLRLAVRATVATLLVTMPHHASAEWTLGGFIGVCRTEETSLTLHQPAGLTEVVLTPVYYDDASLEAPLYYGYRVGVFPRHGWLGIEGEFIHFKVFADTARPTRMSGMLRGQMIDAEAPVASAIERFSISHGVNVLLVNTVVRRQASHAGDAEARWSIIGRAGAGPSIPHPESTIDGVSLEQYEWGALAVQVAGGAEVRVARHLYVMGEYKLTRTKQDVTIAVGAAQTPLVTHHLAFGVVAHLP